MPQELRVLRIPTKLKPSDELLAEIEILARNFLSTTNDIDDKFKKNNNQLEEAAYQEYIKARDDLQSSFNTSTQNEAQNIFDSRYSPAKGSTPPNLLFVNIVRSTSFQTCLERCIFALTRLTLVKQIHPENDKLLFNFLLSLTKRDSTFEEKEENFEEKIKENLCELLELNNNDYPQLMQNDLEDEKLKSIRQNFRDQILEKLKSKLENIFISHDTITSVINLFIDTLCKDDEIYNNISEKESFKIFTAAVINYIIDVNPLFLDPLSKDISRAPTSPSSIEASENDDIELCLPPLDDKKKEEAEWIIDVIALRLILGGESMVEISKEINLEIDTLSELYKTPICKIDHHLLAQITTKCFLNRLRERNVSNYNIIRSNFEGGYTPVRDEITTLYKKEDTPPFKKEDTTTYKEEDNPARDKKTTLYEDRYATLNKTPFSSQVNKIITKSTKLLEEIKNEIIARDKSIYLSQEVAVKNEKITSSELDSIEIKITNIENIFNELYKIKHHSLEKLNNKKNIGATPNNESKTVQTDIEEAKTDHNAPLESPTPKAERGKAILRLLELEERVIELENQITILKEHNELLIQQAIANKTDTNCENNSDDSDQDRRSCDNKHPILFTKRSPYTNTSSIEEQTDINEPPSSSPSQHNNDKFINNSPHSDTTNGKKLKEMATKMLGNIKGQCCIIS